MIYKSDITAKIEELLAKQLRISQHFSAVFENLKQTRQRVLYYNGFEYTLQFNPARIGSSTAKTDIKVQTNDCFLCEQHRFKNQIPLEYNSQYNILINPFPIFSRHLTIVDKSHTKQSIIGQEQTFLEMALSMPNYTVFYNAPKCGASAPFHRHFQAGETIQMPIFNQINKLRTRHCTEKTSRGTMSAYKINDGTRRFVSIESQNLSEALDELKFILMQLCQIYNTNEPEANIGTSFDEQTLEIVIFPREKHRPKEYFFEDENKITISPGFADMAGIIPCAIEKDYQTITEETITSIMNQVSINAEKFNLINL